MPSTSSMREDIENGLDLDAMQQPPTAAKESA